MRILTIGENLGREDCPYMKRWVLNLGLFSIRLHHWYRSDDDRHMHDHPWSFLGLVLKGSYDDITSNGSVTLKAGKLFYRKAKHLHYVKVPKGRDCWTLLLTGPVIRKWGFQVGDKWRKANKYFFIFGKHPCE